MLTTSLTRLLGIDQPIIQAGMGAWATADLAAAVSNAGGLGTLGSIGASPDAFDANIRRCADLTERPFAVNLVCFDWAPFASQMLDIALSRGVRVVTLSFGEPWQALGRCRVAGVTTIVQLQDVEAAGKALAAGADALVVQGNEAGGHTGKRGTLSLAAQVLEFAGDVPVAVAGGIANGRGLAAALAMGAGGVVMGTRFKATGEFAIDSAAKEDVVASNGGNTYYGPIVDLAYGGEWPNQVTGRVLSNRFTAEWHGREQELSAAVAAQPPYAFAEALDRDPATRLNWAGESAGMVHEILPAADVVHRTVAEAEALLRAAAAMLGA